MAKRKTDRPRTREHTPAADRAGVPKDGGALQAARSKADGGFSDEPTDLAPQLPPESDVGSAAALPTDPGAALGPGEVAAAQRPADAADAADVVGSEKELASPAVPAPAARGEQRLGVAKQVLAIEWTADVVQVGLMPQPGGADAAPPVAMPTALVSWPRATDDALGPTAPAPIEASEEAANAPTEPAPETRAAEAPPAPAELADGTEPTAPPPPGDAPLAYAAGPRALARLAFADACGAEVRPAEANRAPAIVALLRAALEVAQAQGAVGPDLAALHSTCIVVGADVAQTLAAAAPAPAGPWAQALVAACAEVGLPAPKVVALDAVLDRLAQTGPAARGLGPWLTVELMAAHTRLRLVRQNKQGRPAVLASALVQDVGTNAVDDALAAVLATSWQQQHGPALLDAAARLRLGAALKSALRASADDRQKDASPALTVRHLARASEPAGEQAPLSPRASKTIGFDGRIAAKDRQTALAPLSRAIEHGLLAQAAEHEATPIGTVLCPEAALWCGELSENTTAPVAPVIKSAFHARMRAALSA